MHITYLCSTCDTPEPKIITIFTRQHYCGRHCLAEGQLKYVQLILRANAEGIEHG